MMLHTNHEISNEYKIMYLFIGLCILCLVVNFVWQYFTYTNELITSSKAFF